MSDEILKEILSEIKSIKSQQEENTDMIRALLSNSEVHNARLENIENKLAHIKGNLVKVNTKANLALDNAAQNRLDIASLQKNS